MKENIIQDFGELHGCLASYQSNYRWCFRGHSSVHWKLIPKAGRSATVVKNEKDYFASWKRRAVEYVSAQSMDDWDWLSVAQHHGLPTRLLDWSMNPMIAAYFAVAGEAKEDAAIYAFSPAYYVLREKVKPLDYRSKFGIALFRPDAYTSRIARQSGVFTVHGPANTEIKDKKEIGVLERIIIPKSNVTKIRKALDHYGYNHASLFPDLDGLSAHMNWIISERDLIRQMVEEEKSLK